MRFMPEVRHEAVNCTIRIVYVCDHCRHHKYVSVFGFLRRPVLPLPPLLSLFLSDAMMASYSAATIWLSRRCIHICCDYKLNRCKGSANWEQNHYACLSVMPRCSLPYVKIRGFISASKFGVTQISDTYLNSFVTSVTYELKKQKNRIAKTLN